MNWMETIEKSVAFMENALWEDIGLKDVARELYMAPSYLQKGFSVMTGYTIQEYIRNRRLYLAAVRLQNTKDSQAEIAAELFYESVDSFTKAFTRFHKTSPTNVRQGQSFRIFLPLKIQLTVQGGDNLQGTIKTMESLQTVGFLYELETEEAENPENIEKLWENFAEEYMEEPGLSSQDPLAQAVHKYKVGSLGIRVYPIGQNEDKTIYIIAGEYTGGEVPAGLISFAIPSGRWAVFQSKSSTEHFEDLRQSFLRECREDYDISRKYTVSVEWGGEEEGENINYSAFWMS